MTTTRPDYATGAEPVTLTPPRPVVRPVMVQGWHDLASLHWPYDPGLVQRLLPAGLRVDTLGGAAWVGLIPFHMRRIRVPRLPPLGRWSTFPEINVRTYVVDPAGRRAVWFCSLDVPRLVPTLVARASYGLPYCWGPSSIVRNGDVITYRTSRRWPRRDAGTRLAIRVGPEIDDRDLSELERFVTARWSLASRHLATTMWADVDHAPWPLHRAEVVDCDDTLIAAAGLPAPAGEPLALWSPGVEVRIGWPHRLRP